MPKFNPNKSPNADMLKSIQQKAVTTANSRATIDLPLSEIDENPDNSIIFNMNDIERLAKTIENEGFYGIVEAYKMPNGRYELSSGHRRTRAVRMLGWKTVPAIVIEKPSDVIPVRRKLVFSNINNRNMSPMDWARALDYHKQTVQMQYGNGVNSKRSNVNILEIVAEEFGFSKATVIRYLKLMSLIPDLQDLVDQRLVAWVTLAVSCANESEEVQQKIADKIKDTLSMEVSPDGTPEPISKGTLQSIIRKYTQTSEEVEKQTFEKKRPDISYAEEAFDVEEGEIEEVVENEDFPLNNIVSSTSASVVESVTKVIEHKIVADTYLKNLSITLDKIVNDDCIIENKERVSSIIKDIEHKLNELKEKL